MKQKLIKGPIKGYKGTDNNMCCHGFQYKIGENVLDNDKPLELCENGFHFCQQPSGIYAYSNYDRIFEIEAYDILPSIFEPGADYKQVCRKIVFIKEINITGYGNTGHSNTGHSNTGDCNTGDRNTGNCNTGHCNTGNRNTGYYNTGDRNTGDYNTGRRNTGHCNTGNRNTGHRNTGNYNLTDYSTGYFNTKEQPIIIFDKPTNIKRDKLPISLMDSLQDYLMQDVDIDPKPFLEIPNATTRKIKALHKKYKELRKQPK